MRVMVIGASSDRSKFGNKAVRAYRSQDHGVVPVNPKGGTIEGLETATDVTSPDGPFDRALLYLPPGPALETLEQLAERDDVGELWLNPGADDPSVVRRARELGLPTVQACSIVDIDVDPNDL